MTFEYRYSYFLMSTLHRSIPHTFQLQDALFFAFKLIIYDIYQPDNKIL